MTVGSECSSTISTEDERTNSPGGDEESSSPTLTAEPRHITGGLSEKEEAATPEQEIKKAAFIEMHSVNSALKIFSHDFLLLWPKDKQTTTHL